MSQSKNITKTVLILVAVMATILALFLNKITTPRYLSDIELKINGLILLKDKHRQVMSSKLQHSQLQWMLVAQNAADQKVLEDFLSQVKKSIRKKMVVAELNSIVLPPNIFPQDAILLVNPQGQWVAYVKPPYQYPKMLLTLSSVITHRK